MCVWIAVHPQVWRVCSAGDETKCSWQEHAVRFALDFGVQLTITEVTYSNQTHRKQPLIERFTDGLAGGQAGRGADVLVATLSPALFGEAWWCASPTCGWPTPGREAMGAVLTQRAATSAALVKADLLSIFGLGASFMTGLINVQVVDADLGMDEDGILTEDSAIALTLGSLLVIGSLLVMTTRVLRFGGWGCVPLLTMWSTSRNLV